MRRGRRSIDEKFVLYDTAEECAKAAAPIFQENRWQWAGCGIPSEAQILSTLRDLQEFATERETKYGETGCLIYNEGRFGHQRSVAGHGRTN